jgi:hypothetical protein
MVTLSEIRDAFLFVSSIGYGENSAYLCLDTGRISYQSDLAGIEEAEDAGVELVNCIKIPHKNDLDLGQSLVFEFVDKLFLRFLESNLLTKLIIYV